MLNSSAEKKSPITTVQNNPFYQDVIDGLQKPNKSLPPKYFYDSRGSKFFDQICALPEYYPYRTELKLLPSVASQVRPLLPRCASVVEFGAGSLKKIQFLLDGLNSIQVFVPIDIAKDHLFSQCKTLTHDYPNLEIHPIPGDFCQHVKLPEDLPKSVLGFFPGSTIGNFSPIEARKFLENAAITLGEESHLLIGVDTKKSPTTLHKAYNDNQNVTAEFNLNILLRINNELGGDINLQEFEHYAFYNAAQGRIEMHLSSKKAQTITVGDHAFQFEKGETIHTESSYKYNPEEFIAMAESSGWSNQKVWLGENQFFSMFLLKANRPS